MNGIKRENYIPQIDGLRAIAVLAVIVYHMDILPFFTGGFTGVDVFFVISGYVISKSLAAKSWSSFAGYLSDFYRRRILRILPALVICMIITIVISTLFIPTSWLSNSIDNTGLAAFFGYSNFTLAFDNNHYFSPRAEYNPFLHTWSLAVEEQFYLLFPVLFFFWLKLKDRKTIGNRLSWLILLAPAAGSLLYSILVMRLNHDYAFYLLPSRFWELALGAMLFQIHSRGKLIPTGRIASLCSIGGLALVTTGFLAVGRNSIPFPGAILPALGASLFICSTAGATSPGSFIHRVMRSRIMTYTGRISYSLYLWHWPISVFLRWTYGFESPVSKIVYVVMTLLMAMLSYHAIEKPVRNSRFLLGQKRWIILAAGVLVIVSAHFSARAIVSAKDRISLCATRDAYTWFSRRYRSDGPNEPITADPKIVGRRIFAIGDSHTAAYRTMLNIVSKELGVEVFEYEAGDCAVAGLLRPMADLPGCEEFLERSLAAISELRRPGDIVFLASLRMPELAGHTAPANIDRAVDRFFSAEASRDREIALEEATEFIAGFEAAGLIVLFEAPPPVLMSPPYRLADWFNRMNPIGRHGLTIDVALLHELRAPVMASISILEERFTNLHVWDPMEVLCTGDVFSAFDESGKPFLIDGDHLSAHGNRILAPSFREKLMSIWSNRTE